MGSQRIAVVGCGAIGAVILAYLARGGRDVTGIDPWPERVYRIAAEGLALEGVEESFTAAPRVIFPDEVGPAEKFDVVILSVKGYDNRWAALYAGDILTPGGVLLSAQNGLHEVALPALAGGADRVIGCVVAMGAEALGPAAVKCSTGGERPHLVIGELSGAESARVTALAELLAPAGPVAATTDIWGELWSKMTQNVMSNGLAGICGFTAGRLWTDPRCTDIVVAAAHECALVARAQGAAIHPILGAISHELLLAAEHPGSAAWAEATGLLRAEGRRRTGKRDNASSLLQDLWKGRRTEVDYFNGVLDGLGASLEVDTPVSRLITRVVHRLERQEVAGGTELLDEVHQQVLAIAAA
ncbi:MAG TPA: 2-dehydropantoate 2-reductase [Trebonia sp.]|jgi:2-dehydropantoate 2-reductase|nr:2-dehydropantoate 2-reductase [Trebonia sp.]